MESALKSSTNWSVSWKTIPYSRPKLSYRKSPIKRPPGAYLFHAHLRGGLIETGGLFNLETTIASVLHKELEYKVEKLKYKKF